MAYDEKSAVYALNSYLWKVLESNLGWSKANYDGATPIIPSSQQPEFMQKGKAFIVYGSVVQPSGHLYDHEVETVAYTIWSPTITEANRISNLIKEVFKRQDDAAADVNLWLDYEGDPSRRGSHRSIGFTSIKVNMAEKADPADEEGGYAAATVVVETRYIVKDTSSVQTVFTTYP